MHILKYQTQREPLCQFQTRVNTIKNHNLDFIARLLNVCWLYTLGLLPLCFQIWYETNSELVDDCVYQSGTQTIGPNFDILHLHSTIVDEWIVAFFKWLSQLIEFLEHNIVFETMILNHNIIWWNFMVWDLI